MIRSLWPCAVPAISPSLKPNSRNTSSVCSPHSGGAATSRLGVRDSVTGWPTTLQPAARITRVDVLHDAQVLDLRIGEHLVH